MGHQIQILKLQGYLFFGTANALLGQIKRQATNLEPDLPQFIVLDFEQVIGLDSSVAYSFIKLKQAAKPPLRIVITHLRPDFQDLLIRQGGLEPNDSVYYLLPTLDSGLEWCEAQLLDTLSWRRRRYIPLALQLQKLFADPEQIAPFMTYLDKQELPAQAVVFDQGQPADHLFFLESGQISTAAAQTGREPLRERTYQPGTVIGAAAFYAASTYPVQAITDQPSMVYSLSRDRWQAMLDETPKTAAIFQEMLMAQLADRLLRASEDLQSLLA
jgi:SulP family sulfate permease